MRCHRLGFSAFLLLFSVLVCGGHCDESPGFFLKITKNIPRLGKRADESFFMKNVKSIPRFGRSPAVSQEVTPLLSWLWNLSPTTPLSKRRLEAPITSTEHELSVVQPVNSNTLIELLDRDAIPSEHVKFVHWKDFDRALLSDAELYAKVVSLGRKPDQRLKQDINLSSFIPIFGAAGGSDFMLYNSNDRGQYDNGNYNGDFLQYNHVK